MGKTPLSVTAPPAPPPVVPINPSGFTATETSQGVVRLSWQPVSGASYYVLLGPGLPLGGVKVGQVKTGLPEVGFTATAVTPGRQEWAVASYYDPGPVSTPAAAFPRVSLIVSHPVPINPSGFVGVQIAPGQVRLSWKPVSGVSYYIVTGSGLPLNGTRVNPPTFGASGAGGTVADPDLEFIVNAVGLSTWQVGSYYDPGPVSTPFDQFPRITLDVTR